MTYKEVVDRIKRAVNDHRMLADFGYGQLSDIKVLDEDGDGANYPYAFLNPAGVVRNQQATTYSFNLITMEMAITPQAVLQIQSDCIQYLNDIISELRFDATFSGDVLLTNSIQVFTERFQDEVAGATASFNIVVADPLDNCDAPFGVWTDWSITNWSSQTNSFNSDLVLTPNICVNQPLGDMARALVDIRYTVNGSLAGEQYPYLTIYEYYTNEETGVLEETILARQAIDVNAIGQSLVWQPEFEVDCKLDELAGNKFIVLAWGATQGENQPAVPGAITLDGTYKIQYKI